MLGGVLPRRRRSLAALLLVSALTLTGCGSAPGTIGPSGVDELTIPTPSPNPADFVEGVDNRWLPLPVGARWTYRVDHDAVPDAGAAVEVVATVPPTTRTIQGVEATELLEEGTAVDGRVVLRARSWYAQDRLGNVWLLAQRLDRPESGEPAVAWSAGTAGAEAGLAMPASPRTGDGFLMMRQPGVREQRATVGSVSDAIQLPDGPAADVVVLDVETEGHASTRAYAPGVGLALLDDVEDRWVLVAADLPERG